MHCRDDGGEEASVYGRAHARARANANENGHDPLDDRPNYPRGLFSGVQQP